MITRVNWNDRPIAGVHLEDVTRYPAIDRQPGCIVLRLDDPNVLGPLGSEGDLEVEATDRRACHVRARVGRVTVLAAGVEVLLIDCGGGTGLPHR